MGGAIAIGAVALAILASALFAGMAGRGQAHKPGQPDKPKEPDKPADPGILIPAKPKEPDGPMPVKPFVPPDSPVGPTPGITQPIETPADPLRPTPTPTEGQYFQCRECYYGDMMTRDCYLGDPRPEIAWAEVVAHSLNAWCAYKTPPGWTGGIVPKYSGHGTKFGSGHSFPVLYFPKRKEMKK